ncbi:MAG: sulfotransferase [Okeania sp. SIO3I5]|uniref:sulfotransferase n=1 Tax=Okeania sp. SIO3I5 TaxID=2607805 RepID=UPI0013B86747|nr:sulfotransferase [Okeania sp. SIO3I5]NEQ41725.1 sulfotransferase [Okeania sp. SIO3I5]
MKATQLIIQNRYRKPGDSPVVNVDDFTYREGAILNADTVINDPNISLYCLDDKHQQAIFVSLPSDIKLSRVPFYYQAQFDNAQSLIALPYECLHDLAERVQTKLEKLILVYSTGRSGSTLLSHIFNESGKVVSFSEPDMLTQLIHLRQQKVSAKGDLEITSLIRDCVRLIFKPIQAEQIYHQAIKFRNQCVALIGLFHQVFPKAKNLFLYRNAIDYVASEYRLMIRYRSPELVSVDRALAWLERYHGTIALEKLGIRLKKDVLSWVECFALNWLIIMDRALNFLEQNIPMLPVRYEDLNSNRFGIVAQIFEYCDLPTTSVTQALKAFERDSQAGTTLARDGANRGNFTTLDESDIAQIVAIVALHPVIQSPEFIIPGTL